MVIIWIYRKKQYKIQFKTNRRNRIYIRYGSFILQTLIYIPYIESLLSTIKLLWPGLWVLMLSLKIILWIPQPYKPTYFHPPHISHSLVCSYFGGMVYQHCEVLKSRIFILHVCYILPHRSETNRTVSVL